MTSKLAFVVMLLLLGLIVALLLLLILPTLQMMSMVQASLRQALVAPARVLARYSSFVGSTVVTEWYESVVVPRRALREDWQLTAANPVGWGW